MADLSDVTAYLAGRAADAVYPNGINQPSVAGVDVRIFEGWPIPEKLDRDVQGLNDNGTSRASGPAAQVSVYPMSGTGITVYQILDQTYVITPPSITTQISVSDTIITVNGPLAAGEYLTLVLDDAVICSQTGPDVPTMLASLATEVQGHGYTAIATGNQLTVLFGHKMVVRQGGTAVMGRVTHRQKHPVMVTVWAPNPDVRRALASAIDNKIKTANKVSMPDTSQAIVVYNRTLVTDEQQAASIYRRDIIFDVEYATVEEFPGYVITSTTVSIATPDNAAIATAIA